MLEAGWKYAVDGLPGCYVPAVPTPASHWRVEPERVREIVLKYGGEESLATWDRISGRRK